MEITGKLIHIGQVQEFGSNGFKKQEAAIETDEGEYPQKIGIEFVQDKCSLLNNYRVGDSVKVHVNLRGRDWTNPQGEVKYFNSLQGWKIEAVSGQAAPEQTAPTIAVSSAEDDLPF